MQSSVKTEFLKSIEAGRAPHACFISCSDASIALEVARQAAARFCDAKDLENCPNFFAPAPPFSKGLLRDLLSELSKHPFYNEGRAILLENAHTMDFDAQHILLKSLEEPPSGTMFLLTGNYSAMLPTIRSRCAHIRLDELSTEEIIARLCEKGAKRSEARIWALAGGGSLPESLRLYEDAEYRALRGESLELLRSVLSGALPYDAARRFAKEGTAKFVLRFWLSFCGDMLRIKCEAGEPNNLDFAADLGNMAKGFTTGALTCMIELLCAAMQRLETTAPAAPTLCRLFLDIQEAAEQ